MISIPRSSPQWIRGARLRAFLIAFAFGATGFLFGMQKLASVTLKHIVANDPSLSFQEVSDFLPVPRKLDWNLPFIQMLNRLNEARGPLLSAAALVLLCALGGVFLVIVLSGEAPAKAAVPQSSPETPGSELAAPPPDAVDGIGDAHQTGAPARRLTWPIPAILYVVCVVLLVLLGIPPISETLLRYYHTLGTFHQGSLERIAVPSVTSAVSNWAAGGLILFAICSATCRAGERAAAAACAVILLCLSAWCQHSLSIRTLAKQRDWSPAILAAAPPYKPDRGYYGVPDGTDAAQLLASRLKLKFGNQPGQSERPIVLFLPGGYANVTQVGFTEDGLAASAESVKPVRAFLEERHYESALSWVATKHLFNVGTVHFDTTAAIDACMTDMENYPHLSQCGNTTRGMLFTCAASPENLAFVDRWADERRFAHPTRESQRLMGQLYERFGLAEKALDWYRRADMPHSFLERVRTEKPLFHVGRISGRLMLNGKPLEGALIGAIPRRLNGLPQDMEPFVLRARGELLAFRPSGDFPQYHPRPYAFRWISASSVSDAAGRFEISELTEGEYMLVCTLPSSTPLEAPSDPRLSVSNPPPPIVVNYAHPSRDVGTVSFKVAQ